MKKYTLIHATAIAVLAAGSATAATVDGNLTIEATVAATCDAPAPSANLILPFDSSATLTTQALPTTPVTVTISCDGSPTISQVSFSDGTGDGNLPAMTRANDIRYMQRDGSSGTANTDYLGYKLWAAVGDTGVDTTDQVIGSQTNGSSRVLDLSGSADGTFQVTGMVYDDGAQTEHASASDVPDGTYRDTVVMTVTYN
jgi:spore coat protein U-like protein